MAEPAEGEEVAAPAAVPPPPAPPPAAVRRFEFVHGTSTKFWEVGQRDAELTVRFGRIGTNGQTQTRMLASEERAARELEKLVAEKLRKGYREI